MLSARARSTRAARPQVTASWGARTQKGGQCQDVKPSGSGLAFRFLAARATKLLRRWPSTRKTGVKRAFSPCEPLRIRTVGGCSWLGWCSSYDHPMPSSRASIAMVSSCTHSFLLLKPNLPRMASSAMPCTCAHTIRAALSESPVRIGPNCEQSPTRATTASKKAGAAGLAEQGSSPSRSTENMTRYWSG